MNESPRHPGLFQEADHVPAGWSYGLALFFAVSFFSAIALAIFMVQVYTHETVTPFTAEERPPRTQRIPDVPVLGTINVTNLWSDSTTKTTAARERQRLDAGFAWADSARTRVTIPIERAMELVADSTAGATPFGRGGGAP